VQAIPYLDACLKEALRVHHALGFNIDRLVPSGGRKVLDEFLPVGTIVSKNAWTVHQDKGIFGDDVALFRPERWLEDKEKSAGMWKYMFHFGAGSHLCFGRNIAMLERYKFFRIFLKKL
jgi:cytochrome P450